MVSSDFCNKTKKEKGTLSNWAHESIEGQRVGLMMIFKSSSPSRNCPTASIFFSLSSSRLLKIKESAIQIVQFDTKRHYTYISIDLKWYYIWKLYKDIARNKRWNCGYHANLHALSNIVLLRLSYVLASNRQALKSIHRDTRFPAGNCIL